MREAIEKHILVTILIFLALFGYVFWFVIFGCGWEGTPPISCHVLHRTLLQPFSSQFLTSFDDPIFFLDIAWLLALSSLIASRLVPNPLITKWVKRIVYAVFIGTAIHFAVLQASLGYVMLTHNAQVRTHARKAMWSEDVVWRWRSPTDILLLTVRYAGAERICSGTEFEKECILYGSIYYRFIKSCNTLPDEAYLEACLAGNNKPENCAPIYELDGDEKWIQAAGKMCERSRRRTY